MQASTGMKLMGVLFVLAGLGLICFFLRNTLLVRESRNWPTAPGKVLSSSVETYTYTTTETRNGKETNVTKTGYRARVDYEYAVALGNDAEASKLVRCTSNQIYITGKYGDPKLISLYPAGKQIQVHYDPHQLTRSFLEPESTESVIPLIAGLVFGGAGVFLFRQSRQFSFKPSLRKRKTPLR